MKTGIFRVCSIVTAILAVVAVIGAVTVTGGDFLDLSNLARYALNAIAVVFAAIAFVTGRKGWRAKG